MTRALAAALLALLALLGLQAPASASEGDSPAVPFRLDSTYVQVVPHFETKGSGWQVHRAISAWNAAQDTVHLTRRPTPGAAVIHLRRYFAPKMGSEYGKAVYSGWARGQWSPTGTTWTFHEATVYLNVAYKPRNFNCQPYVTLAHEIGHALGLPHSPEVRSVMNEYADLMGHYCPRPTPTDAGHLAGLYAS